MSNNNIPDRPERITSDETFEQFLASVGLTLQLRRGPDGEPFGNWIIRFADANLEVSMVSDRGDQAVSISDKNTLRAVGIFPPAPPVYDVPLISESLFGIAPKRLEFFDQKVFVHANWEAIVAMFRPESREATHRRLQFLGRERLKRRLPPWPRVILEFESYLKSIGLACEVREAPEGALGDHLMQYGNDSIGVRMASKGGWALSVSDKTSRPEIGYSIFTIRNLLAVNLESELSFPEWFAFARTNWDAILAIFSPANKEENHRRLVPLEEEIQRRLQLRREQQDALTAQLAEKIRQLPKQ